MAIFYDTSARTFTLHTAHTTQQLQLTPNGFLLHLYYGRRASGALSYRVGRRDRGFSGNPYDVGEDRTFSADVLPLVYPCDGCGDYRPHAIALLEGGCDLRYVSHEITEDKYALPGLPAVYAGDACAQTLRIVLADARTGLEVTLLFGVLESLDVITRAAEIRNRGTQPLTLMRAASASLDWLCGKFDLIHFPGRYANERMQTRTALVPGSLCLGSQRGTSSHQQSPFVMLAAPDTTEKHGDCYGFSLLYSGGFRIEAHMDSIAQLRLQIGIQDAMLHLSLAPDASFVTPEVACAYTHEGLGALSQRFHTLMRHHVCRGFWKTRRRPILLNSWEATYFTFDSERIYQLAQSAQSLGVEMLVLDDGWFGKRNSDQSGLGDWFVNEEKMGGTLGETVARVRALGLRFGLWMEPEAVSEDSDLYRAHPDWAFHVPGRKPVRSRHQLMLDFSKPEVVDAIFASITAVLDSADISYLKMDMNRSLCDVWHAAEPTMGRDAILYRYTLGVYDFLERLHARYPELLIEGCSGGGGRFDAGMLYYCPQIWCSDNTDAIERLRIQHGTSFGFPVSAIGAHVSAVPNHQTGRVTPFSTRAVVAMTGSFGYELDPEKLTEDEREEIRLQIAQYKADFPLLHDGLYFRLTEGSDPDQSACLFVSKDRSQALLHLVTLSAHANAPEQYLFLRGLDSDAAYRIRETGRVHSGSALMYAGWRVPRAFGEYWALTLHLHAMPTA